MPSLKVRCALAAITELVGPAGVGKTQFCLVSLAFAPLINNEARESMQLECNVLWFGLMKPSLSSGVVCNFRSQRQLLTCHCSALVVVE
jgi:hypothetical protein